MKKIISIILPITIAIVFTACGGGGGDSSFSNNSNNTSTSNNIPINIPCLVGNISINDFASYLTLNSGDQVLKNDDSTVVTIYHNISGEKKVCLNSGSAYIVRN